MLEHIARMTQIYPDYRSPYYVKVSVGMFRDLVERLVRDGSITKRQAAEILMDAGIGVK